MKINIESINDLIDLVQGVGFHTTRTDDRSDFKQVGTHEGAFVNWFSSTGTLSFQGHEGISKRLEELIRKELQQKCEVPLTF